MTKRLAMATIPIRRIRRLRRQIVAVPAAQLLWVGKRARQAISMVSFSHSTIAGSVIPFHARYRRCWYASASTPRLRPLPAGSETAAIRTVPITNTQLEPIPIPNSAAAFRTFCMAALFLPSLELLDPPAFHLSNLRLHQLRRDIHPESDLHLCRYGS